MMSLNEIGNINIEIPTNKLSNDEINALLNGREYTNEDNKEDLLNLIKVLKEENWGFRKQCMKLRNERVELLQKCENLEDKLKYKNNEISYLCEVIDALEEEKEELDDECYELEEENAALIQEIKQLKGENMRLKFKSIAEKMEDTHISDDLVRAGLKTFDSSWHNFGLSEDELKDVLTAMENSKSNYPSLLKEIDEACRMF